MANENFLKTVSKYPTFLAGVLLGIFFSAFGWIKPLFRTPVSATLAVLGLLGLIAFMVFTVRSMLQLG